MILNKHQAETAYSAMCALNNVGARAKIEFNNPMIAVIEYASGRVHVLRCMGGLENVEVYDNQSAFVTAYGLE